MASLRVEHDPLYKHKHLGMWFVAFCTYAYQSLGAKWPQGIQEWVLFSLGAVVFIAGGIQSYSGASKGTT